MASRKPIVLSQSDQAFFDQAGGGKWMRRKVFRDGPQKRYKRSLDAFSDRLAELGLDPRDPRTLQELLAIVLDKDGTMGAWFRDHNFPVGNPSKFGRLCRVAAGALVAEYLHRTPPREGSNAVLLDAHIQGQVATLVEFAVEQGELSAAEGRDAGEDWWTIDGRADLLETARSKLEELLSSDVNVAHLADPDVPEAERQREIAKAALLQLKLTQLRRLAEAEDLAPLKDAEALAELVVRKYDADQEAIAELVLRFSVPDVERGWATRLIPLQREGDLQRARTTLSGLQGKYLRLDVATWLVFTKVDETQNGVSFEGEIRFYSVRPQREGDRSELAALQRAHPIALRMRLGQRWAVLDGRSATDVRRLRRALSYALAVEPSTHLDPNVPPLEGEVALWDPVTTRMLFLLEHGLRDQHLDYETFRQAEFSRTGITAADPQQVSVRAVRLQGQHVMDDPSACRYITAGQTLTSVDVRVRWRPDLRRDAFYTNVRLGMATDHAYVMTAFGESAHEAHGLHRELIERVRRALQAAIAPEDLSGMAKRIVDRAREAEPPEAVDIWAPAEQKTAEAETL